jgi:putative oxygen-independent coproporphyrinogen III oxidase
VEFSRTLSAYVHVPYCRVRCGYCDFNTYTSSELRGAKQADFADHVAAEMAIAQARLNELGDQRSLSTIFFGGGTPTLLPVSDLVRTVTGLRASFGIAPGAEVTVEANPDSVDREYLQALAEGGVTRVSFGVQSAVPHVLAVLDRTHDSSRVPEVVQSARDAGLAVSIDLIYGTPGESLDDWRRSLDLVAELHVDHVSAYSLIVEDGTALERKIRRGELPVPDANIQADMYELADAAFESMGLTWYELSNWSRRAQTQSAHNMAYWLNQDWWGFGAGAHSYLNGRRWWNVKHPAAYAQRVLSGLSPEADGETPTNAQTQLERVLLGTRLKTGFALAELDAEVRPQVPALIAEGLIEGRAALTGQIVLTLKGRLLADDVVRRLTT